MISKSQRLTGIAAKATQAWIINFYVHVSVAITGGILLLRPVTRNCNPGIRIPDRFSIPKSQYYERPNPGILGLENNILTLLLRVKCMH